jgi:hypothetical protein
MSTLHALRGNVMRNVFTRSGILLLAVALVGCGGGTNEEVPADFAVAGPHPPAELSGPIIEHRKQIARNPTPPPTNRPGPPRRTATAR